ncbi:MAG: helix-turn-helix transcriptional regulator [Cyclobacteriaceae bacterium]
MTSSIGTILSLLAAFQLFFVAVYLFTHQKGNKRNNRLLAIVFLLFAINLTDLTARISGIILPIPLLHLLDDGFFFLYGPLLYWYTQGVVYRDFKLTKTDSWHLVLFIVITGLLIIQIIFTDLSEQTAIAQNITSTDLPIWISASGMFIYLHMLSYLWLSWISLKKYQSVIRDKFSRIDEINLGWLSFMIRTFSGITVVAMISNIIPVFGNIYILYTSIVLLLVISLYFINRVLVKALNQPAIFSGIERDEPERYASSTLDFNTIEGHKSQLLALMESERPYLNPDLKSKDLADHLDLNQKVFSQVINQSFNQNFFDFINTYRCEEVKKILQGPDEKITIIEAMYQSGFNSKSSFNKEFKKLTGQTPSEFKKSLSTT